MNQPPTLVWGASNWLTAVATIAVIMLLLLVWGYWRKTSRGIRFIAASLKAFGILILAMCLLEPLFSGTRARPGANQFVVLVDNSQSMTLKDRDNSQTRGEQLKSLVARDSKWILRLGQDFDLRQYAFDTQLTPLPDAKDLSFDGGASNLGASLDRLVRRFSGRPLAGIILLTDGNATDVAAVERLLSEPNVAAGSTHVPPLYPVLIGGDNPARDVNLQQIAVTQTNFEDAPVTLAAQVVTSGYANQIILARVSDESGKLLEEQKVKVEQDNEPMTVRFRLRPEQPGISFYRVSVAARGTPAQATTLESEKNSDEATLANNQRLVAVDRGQGPYRVLYVAGRPNWEYKFLHRAVESDSEVQLVGMLRVARREPKFNYLGHTGETSNPLFRGFNNADKDQVEQYDQPVMVRLGTQDEAELRDGFPKKAEDLYRYHAIVLDDLESEFFTQDQMLLVKEFVRQRGGGLLMLGGAESFKNGKYDRTPIGDLLPVYIDEVPTLPLEARFRMSLTREGWLEPWIRLRPEEEAEKQRLIAMPPFQTVNSVRGIKPGATVLAHADIETGGSVPALVEQRFGRGRAAALLIGDLWRWDLKRPANTQSDLEKAWRQTIRWLVAEVPQRIEVSVGAPAKADDAEGTLHVDVRVRDPAYAPLDNAAVKVRITAPDGKPLELTAEASAREAGLYETIYVPRQPGAYRAAVSVVAPDASEVGNVQSGWTSDPAAEEFRDLRPNRALLDRMARSTGGQTVNASDMDSFVAGLPMRHADITEPYIRPMWHQAWVFLLAILCLTAEWGLRRWQGLP